MDLRDQTTVIIPATDLDWFNLAGNAANTAVAAGAAEVYISLEPTLVEARNAGLRAAQTEWCVFLDADDRLPADYLLDVPDDQLDRTVIATRIQYFRGRAWRPFGEPRWPTVWGHDEHDCAPACLPLGNYIHIGALVSTDAAQKIGGFRDWSWSEDWDLWLRLHLAGATFGRHPSAIYQAWRRPGSRNRSLPADDQVKIHHDILRSNGLEP